MAFQRVPNTAEIRIVWDILGKERSTYFHADHAGGYNQAGIDAMAAACDQLLGPMFAVGMSVDDEYLRTEVRGLDAEFDLTATRNLFATIGSVVSVPAPPNVSFVVRKLSAFTGRSARGRVYIAGLPRSDIQTGTGNQDKMIAVNADAWALAVQGARNIIDNVGIWDPVIVSRFSEGAKRAEAIVFDWITSDYATLTLATRRKRLR